MIRTVVIPDKNYLSLNIPDKYIGKKVEVIAFVVEENAEESDNNGKKKKSFSAVKLNTSGFKFNREEANER